MRLKLLNCAPRRTFLFMSNLRFREHQKLSKWLGEYSENSHAPVRTLPMSSRRLEYVQKSPILRTPIAEICIFFQSYHSRSVVVVSRFCACWIPWSILLSLSALWYLFYWSPFEAIAWRIRLIGVWSFSVLSVVRRFYSLAIQKSSHFVHILPAEAFAHVSRV